MSEPLHQPEISSMAYYNGTLRIASDDGVVTESRCTEDVYNLLQALQRDLAAARERERGLVEALTQYADENSWEGAVQGSWHKGQWRIDENGYALAKDALAALAPTARGEREGEDYGTSSRTMCLP